MGRIHYPEKEKEILDKLRAGKKVVVSQEMVYGRASKTSVSLVNLEDAKLITVKPVDTHGKYVSGMYQVELRKKRKYLRTGR
jgi:hypothetical protein